VSVLKQTLGIVADFFKKLDALPVTQPVVTREWRASIWMN